MKRRFSHYLQKFSYTRLDDDEFLLRPFVLKITEETAFQLIKHFLSSKTDIVEAKYEQIHHEIFIKYNTYEVNYLFTSDEEHRTILSISTYAKKKGISYKKLLETKNEIRPIFERFIESE